MENQETDQQYLAFLLAQSLKSHDATEFLNIYDTLIPRDIPTDQVIRQNVHF